MGCTPCPIRSEGECGDIGVQDVKGPYLTFEEPLRQPDCVGSQERWEYPVLCRLRIQEAECRH